MTCPKIPKVGQIGQVEQQYQISPQLKNKTKCHQVLIISRKREDKIKTDIDKPLTNFHVICLYI